VPGIPRDTGAAPYIEDRQALERLCRAPVALVPFARKVPGEQLAQIGNTDRIELVQRLHGSIGIPPLGAETVETATSSGSTVVSRRSFSWLTMAEFPLTSCAGICMYARRRHVRAIDFVNENLCRREAFSTVCPVL